MRRSTLRTFLKQLVLSSLPVGAMGGCGGVPTPVPPANIYLTTIDGGALDGNLCGTYCPSNYRYCTVIANEAGPSYPPLVSCYNPGGGGRRPEGLVTPIGEACDSLGAFFSRSAHLEAASVEAFSILAEELAALGAPRRMIESARRAARDEIRHAEATGRIARRFGGVALPVEVRRGGARSIEAIAIENAVEGCVRETYFAAVAAHQALAAEAPEIRRAMSAIEEDEARHAELAFGVARFLDEKLAPAARWRVSEARAAAVDALAREAGVEAAPDLLRIAGLPCAATATRIVGALAQALWS